MKRALGGLLVLAVLVGLLPHLARPAPIVDLAGSRDLPPLSVVWRVPSDDGRVRVVTDLQGSRARRAGREIELDAEALARAERHVHWLGTDSLGRDLASRLARALINSLTVTALAIALAAALALALGSLAALGGGPLDVAVMRAVDAVMAFPKLLAVLVLGASVSLGIPTLVVVLALLAWPEMARIVRSELAAYRGTDAYLAAIAVGTSPTGRFRRHAVPHLARVVAAASLLRAVDVVLLESAVAFLGVGPAEPWISLGTLVAVAREGGGASPLVTLAPVAGIAAVVLALRAVAASLDR